MKALLLLLLGLVISVGTSNAHTAALEPISLHDAETDEGLYRITQRCGSLLASSAVASNEAGPIVGDIVRKDMMSFIEVAEGIRLKLGKSSKAHSSEMRNLLMGYMSAMKLGNAGELSHIALIINDTDSCSALAKSLDFPTPRVEADFESEKPNRF